MTQEKKPVLAILGASGLMGPHVVSAVLSPQLHDKFAHPIRLTTRDAAKLHRSNPLIELNSDLFDIRTSANLASGEGLDAVFAGVDVVINVAGVQFSHRAIVDAAARCGVKVYLPSEYSVPSGPAALGEYAAFPAFAAKAAATRYALQKQGIKTIAIYCGAALDPNTYLPFIAGSALPILRAYEPDLPFATTRLADMARAAAFVASKALTAAPSYPSEFFIKGGEVSFFEAAGLLTKYSNKPVNIMLSPAVQVLDKAKAALEKLKAGTSLSMDDILTMIQVVYSQGLGNYDAPQNDLLDFKLVPPEQGLKEYFATNKDFF